MYRIFSSLTVDHPHRKLTSTSAKIYKRKNVDEYVRKKYIDKKKMFIKSEELIIHKYDIKYINPCHIKNVISATSGKDTLQYAY